MLLRFKSHCESLIRKCVTKLAEYLPVKVVRDEHGIPFLYRYSLFSFGDNGPGLCLHHFVKSDPDRGYHDHPWDHSLSFILCGGYEERLWDEDAKNYSTRQVPRWSFNHLNGKKTFHRVMLEEQKDAWSLFAFQKRSKLWGMVGLDGTYRNMSKQIEDNDGGWWRKAQKGLALFTRMPLQGNVVATVDVVLVTKSRRVLLIRRGKEPFKNCWAFPGGRVEATDHDLLSAAKRELKEETNIDEIELTQAFTIGNKTRDPRGFCLTTVFTALLDLEVQIRAGDDAVEAEWVYIHQCSEATMAFDHYNLLKMIVSETRIFQS